MPDETNQWREKMNKKEYTTEDPPGSFVVFLHVKKDPKHAFTRMRIASCSTIDEAQQAVKDNIKLRKETYGGLIESAAAYAGPGRYTIWRATGWEKVSQFD